MLVLPPAAEGQERTSAGGPGKSDTLSTACSTPEHRHFDFWLGTWEVFRPDGTPAGVNRIERVLGGCAMTEHWTSVTPYRGTSINFYDAARRRWHQTWIGNDGQPLYLDGGLHDGSIVLEGMTVAVDGTRTRHRITWTPRGDGSVRQHWVTSTNGSKWTDTFDGRYVRRPDPP
jgi:hypothetical protein